MKISKKQLRQIIREEYVRLKIRRKLHEALGNDYDDIAGEIQRVGKLDTSTPMTSPSLQRLSGSINSDREQPNMYIVSLQKGDYQILKRKRVNALVRGNKFDDAPIQLAYRIYDLLNTSDQRLVSPEEIEAAIKSGDIN